MALSYNNLSNLNHEDILKHQITTHNSKWQDEGLLSLTKYVNSLTALLEYISSYFNKGKDSFICEVGSGRGGLIKALIDHGYKNVMGCEPSKFLYSLAISNYGIEHNLVNCISKELFKYVENNHKKIDCLIYWHSLEHIPSALLELKSASNVLCDQGYILIQVPMLYKTWIYPEHLHFINEKTLSYIEDMTDLSVDKCTFDYHHMFMTIFLKKKQSWLHSKYLPPSISSLNILTQHYNCAIAELTKSMGDLLNLLDEKISSCNEYEKIVEDKMAHISAIEKLLKEKIEHVAMLDRLLEKNCSSKPL